MQNFTELFGCDVFTDDIMRERLPKNIYKQLNSVIKTGAKLTLDVADIVANVMKDWAVEKGATHYTHWFQPMTGITAEKHDSFINPVDTGKIMLSFSGKELIKGEPDASSFPNGGIRATFEARGYTAWDCTSPAFVKDGTLYLPTAFCSYTGEALDKKTPLLRSMDVISDQAMRLLKIFGDEKAQKVITTVGAEQEYFLIDKEMFDARKDLMFAGRTLFGSPPPKGQEMDDQYFASLKQRVSAFMHDLDSELWKLGVPSTTKHNEVAPAQHEMAPVFSTSNIATDHNQLTMDVMKKVAERHSLACLLHEKPFAGVNGSGKHNNWAMGTDYGRNLLEPGSTPYKNTQFLVFLSAVIWAVDEYADLLRSTAANPGNDHRLGANEAPPAIISIFLGSQLTEILEKISAGDKFHGKEEEFIEIASALPDLPMDSTDRNRTSPFAFTGNKFEFRMVGSSSSVAGPNFVLNTIIAETISRIADELEGAENIRRASKSIITKVWKEHSRVVFNGDNYTADWLVEAEKRGLPNLSNSVDAIKSLALPKNVDVFVKHGVLTEKETLAREEILLEHYAKIINIEALTMLEMASREILPTGMKYARIIAEGINAIKNTGIEADISAQSALLVEMSSLNANLRIKINELQSAVAKASSYKDITQMAESYRDDVFTKMGELRAIADQMERICDEDIWPLPSYGDMLFRV